MNLGSLPDCRPDIAASQHLMYRLALPPKGASRRLGRAVAAPGDVNLFERHDGLPEA
jgi:hypothetical protein